MKITLLGRIIRTAARGEAVDFDKYDKDGRPNPYHGWTLDFPEHVPTSDRTYSNKERAQGWYDDPENEPLSAGTRWGGSGDYADKAFHTHTQQHNRELDPSREVIDPSGALGQYGVGEEDLNQYHEHGHHLRPGNQTGYPGASFSDLPGVGSRGIYSTQPDLNPWPGMERQPVPARVEDTSGSGRHLGPRISPERQEGWRDRVLPEGHRHHPHDDVGNDERVFGMWHGGTSYAYGDPHEDMESFPSLEDARRAVEGRYGGWNRGHGGEHTAYDPETDSHHLVGNGHDSTLDTPAVDRRSSMDIFRATPHPDGGWNVHHEEEPLHHIWLNGDGDAVVGREHGDYGDHEDDDYEVDHENYGDDEEIANSFGEEGSHPKQRHLVNAGFQYHPHEYNGDRYTREDHNGHTHQIRAPNPGYGSMDNWKYEFHPSNEQVDRDPYVPRNAATDGPRSLSFHARDPEEAYNLHQNLGNDLSELASRGYGFHHVNLGDAGIPGNAREDNRATGVSNHSIEGHRRHADGEGYDRILKTPQWGWAAHHVPDPTPTDRHPSVSVVAQGRSRRDVLDQADHHDARAFLDARGEHHDVDEASGAHTWQVPDRHMGTDYYNVQIPGEGAHNPLWVVTHNSSTRGIVNHVFHPHWGSLREYLMART